MNPQGRERKQIRLRGYDYSQDGYYFVTICTKNMVNRFGEIRNGVMGLNKIGCMVAKYWQEIPDHFSNVILGEWVVMPNHVHGIVVIEGDDNVVGDAGGCGGLVGDADLRPLRLNDRTKMLLPKIIHGFKSSISRRIRKIYPNTSFGWQRFYYDHVIRNEKSLNRIQEYIRYNPLKWEFDEYN